MRAVLLLLVFALPPTWAGAAPPTIEAPKTVYGETGEWCEVDIKMDAVTIKLVQLDAGLKVFPADRLKDPKKVIATALKPGRYKVLLYTGNAEGPSDPVIVTFVFAAPDPNPPGPGPIPPVPVPPVPVVDDLTKAIQKAFDADPAPDRRERAVALAASMRRAVGFSKNAAYGTNDALAVAVSADVKNSVGGSLTTVRAEIGKHLASSFPADVVTLDAALRQRFADAYGKIADAVEATTK